jgi:hypothetical protein
MGSARFESVAQHSEPAGRPAGTTITEILETVVSEFAEREG